MTIGVLTFGVRYFLIGQKFSLYVSEIAELYIYWKNVRPDEDQIQDLVKTLDVKAKWQYGSNVIYTVRYAYI